MAYPALAVANYFIDKATAEGKALDHLKLQKLTYVAHGWFLAVHGQPLLNEPVEAWKYGPVIPGLYQEFKYCGNGPIRENGILYRGGRPTVPSIAYDDEAARSVVDTVWERYKRYTGVQLSNVTHQPGTPWEQTWSEAPGRKGLTIPNERIEQHFLELARRS